MCFSCSLCHFYCTISDSVLASTIGREHIFHIFQHPVRIRIQTILFILWNCISFSILIRFVILFFSFFFSLTRFRFSDPVCLFVYLSMLLHLYRFAFDIFAIDELSAAFNAIAGCVPTNNHTNKHNGDDDDNITANRHGTTTNTMHCWKEYISWSVKKPSF